MPAAYREHPPPPALRDVVLAAWSFVALPDAPLAHVVPPDGCVSISRTAVGLVVVGPRTAPLPLTLPPGAHVDGVRLWPDAAEAVLGVGARSLRGVVAPLAVVAPHARVRWEGDGAALDPDRSCLDATVRAALAAIAGAGGDVTVSAVAASVGWSVRHLERRFADRVGLGVKAYARIVRLRRALVAGIVDAPAPSWARHALDAGYADQAHFVREAVALTGRTPGALDRAYRPLGHVGVAASETDAARRMSRSFKTPPDGPP